MFPSSQTGSGINSSYGLVPMSAQSSSGSADGTRNMAFNWLGHLTGRGVGLFDEPASGMKSSSDQIMDQSFMSIDRHTPTVPRRTPHSSVGGNGSQPGTDATQPPPHPIQDPSMVNAFHPYRLVGDGIVPSNHSSLSTSQFAAFDSLYKAYQGAYGSTAPGGVFGTQPFRFDNPLLTDQRMMLQASLLQYPHLGIFPNAALYPGLPGTGVRYPNDYYGQNLSGMPLSSKYPDVGGTTWLGFDRPMSLLDREKDTKDADRKCDLDLSKRPDKDEHHRDRPERSEVLSLRREPKEDGRRYEDGRKDAMKHTGEKKDQQKWSNSLRSPIRLEGHQPPMQDCGSNRCNSGGPSDFSYSSGRSGHAVPAFGLSTDLSGLAKVSSSPGTVTSYQRQSTSRSDRNIDSVQDHARTKDRHHHHHHQQHHHNWKPEDVKSKATPLMLTVPKTTASASTNGQPLKPFEKKFHRPFEQAQTNSVPAEKLECLPAHGPRDGAAKNSRSVDASLDYAARSADAKAGDGYRFLQQQPSRAAGSGIGKPFEPTSQLHAAAMRKQGSGGGGGGGGGGMRCEEVPLNLVVTKSQNSSCGTVVPANPVSAEPFSNEDYEFPRLHRIPVQPSVPPPIPHSEAGFLGPASWGLVSSDDVCLPRQKSTEGISGSSVVPTVATRGMVAQQPVSKLDLEAKRRAQMRKNSSNSEDEEGDEDEDLLDNSKDLARLLLISSGPPLKQPVAQSKASFLAMFGLMSLDSSKEAAFERRQKRRRLFGEPSISPVLCEESGEPEYSEKKPSFRNEIAPLDKHSFLVLFNLESTRPHTKKRKVASPSDRNDVSRCCREPPLYRSKHSDVVNTLISGNGEQTWPTVDPDCQSLSCDIKCPDVRSRPGGNSSVIRTQDDHRQPNTGFSLSSSAGDSRCVKEGPLDSLPFNVSSRNASTPSAAREAPNDQTPATADLQSSEQTFHWPGLEAVIESYHHYVEEQTMEKQLLREQSQHLRHNNSQLMLTAERLRARMSELYFSKQQLLEERLKTQTLVDGLKDAVKHLI